MHLRFHILQSGLLFFALSVPPSLLAVEPLLVARSGSMPAMAAPAEHFTGRATVELFFKPVAPSRAESASVTFEPAARTDWHTHKYSQTLIVTAGEGRVQRWDGPVQVIRTGDVVQIPPGVRHWHGAGPNASMTHVSVVERPDDGSGTTWMGDVTDEQYVGEASVLSSSAEKGLNQTDQPSRAQQLMGDIAPELANLTDDVLYAQIWADPALSRRDRSLVTVGALLAMGRPQLRSHLALALQNGVSEEELIAAITHLAFYSGWPNSVTAVGMAREVFNEAGTTGEQP